jgi:thiol-disulfide isomerase/thioredoxin
MLSGLLFAALVISAQGAGMEPLNVGEEAPQFTLAPVNPDKCGMKRFSLNYYKSLDDGQRPKYYLITFFSVWCEPCKKELPLLEALHRKYSGAGLMIVNISIDKESNKQELLDLVSKNGTTFPVLWDPSTVTFKRYRVPDTLPYEVLLDADGRIVKVLAGAQAKAVEALHEEIGRLMSGGTAAKPTPAAGKPAEQPQVPTQAHQGK